MMSGRLLAPLLLGASALAAGCGAHQASDTRTVAARQTAAVAGEPGAQANAGASIELVPGAQLADSRAESAHVSALVRCERLSAAAREECRDQADADYQTTLTRAMQLGTSSGAQVTK